MEVNFSSNNHDIATNTFFLVPLDSSSWKIKRVVKLVTPVAQSTLQSLLKELRLGELLRHIMSTRSGFAPKWYSSKEQ